MMLERVKHVIPSRKNLEIAVVSFEDYLNLKKEYEQLKERYEKLKKDYLKLQSENERLKQSFRELEEYDLTKAWRPPCPNCDGVLTKVFYVSEGVPKKAGYVCFKCRYFEEG